MIITLENTHPLIHYHLRIINSRGEILAYAQSFDTETKIAQIVELEEVCRRTKAGILDLDGAPTVSVENCQLYVVLSDETPLQEEAWNNLESWVDENFGEEWRKAHLIFESHFHIKRLEMWKPRTLDDQN